MTDTPTGSNGLGDPPSEYGRLGDRYEIGGLLGRGGMADVRIGRDLRLGRQVAIKRLRSDLASDPTFLARFRREAQSAAALNHPSIVAVYDTGEAPGPDGQTVPYIVMEYVEGETLRDLLRQDRKIMPQRSLEITAEILGALDYSHRAGIVHRDIKPGNVMLTPSGQVKVMDFGIARAIADSSSAMTQTAAVVGTAQYLSPEQARGEQVDARSDIYSTGCLLFELLTERPPFVGDSPVSVAYQHVREEAPTPSTLNPEVSASEDAIVAKALAKRTDERYQSAAEMRGDLERVIAGQTVDLGATQAVPAVPVYPSNQTSVVPVPTAVPEPEAIEDEEEPHKSRAWIWVLAALVALLVVAGAAWGLPKLLGGDDKPAVTTVAVTDVSGDQIDVAQRKLRNAGFEIGDVTRRPNADVEAGQVISTDPPAETKVEEGSIVSLLVSSGPEKVSVPYVIGDKFKSAKSKLEDLGLKVVKEERDDDSPKNEVLNTDPGFNTEVDPGTTVTVTVSKGQVEVPDVVGEKQGDAEGTLDDLGFEVKIVKDPGSDEPKGTVVDQSPGAGEKLTPGATVYITVSDKQPEPTEPTDTATTPPTSTPTPPATPATPTQP